MVISLSPGYTNVENSFFLPKDEKTYLEPNPFNPPDDARSRRVQDYFGGRPLFDGELLGMEVIFRHSQSKAKSLASANSCLL